MIGTYESVVLGVFVHVIFTVFTCSCIFTFTPVSAVETHWTTVCQVSTASCIVLK